jgi:hypothetical protein
LYEELYGGLYNKVLSSPFAAAKVNGFFASNLYSRQRLV